MNVTPSKARKPISGCKAANRTCNGENSSDWGSQIIGQPAKTFGVHQGHSPRPMDAARNCNGGKNCDFASHGMVTAPESQGHAGTRKASAKTAMASGSPTR